LREKNFFEKGSSELDVEHTCDPSTEEEDLDLRPA
jgi:hypothetical protein